MGYLQIKPPDYLSGSKTPGKKYSAWDTYNQGKPDFGKDKGPGDPYHVVQKTVAKPVPAPRSNRPAWAGGVDRSSNVRRDPWLNAIKRRLGVIK